VRYYTTIASPIDDLLLLSNGDALCGVYMDAQKYRPESQPDWRRDDKHFAKAKKQFKAYFAKELTEFDLPLAFAGTIFQNKVWNGLLKIPFGQTWSYQALANHIKSPKAVRAVGLANGKNPLSIIVPCHRVIGSNGTLTGYGGGLPRKQWLLQHEAAQGVLFNA
jgi:methylated-DNA-[protein]-cysteine S-methyltransferase